MSGRSKDCVGVGNEADLGAGGRRKQIPKLGARRQLVQAAEFQSSSWHFMNILHWGHRYRNSGGLSQCSLRRSSAVGRRHPILCMFLTGSHAAFAGISKHTHRKVSGRRACVGQCRQKRCEPQTVLEAELSRTALI